MASSIGSKILTSVAAVALVLAAVCKVRINVPQFRAYEEARALRERLVQDNAARSADLADFRQKQERFVNDEEFVIRVARENRKLFPGEVLYTTPVPEFE